MTQAAPVTREKHPGAGRRPALADSLATIDRQRLRAFIDKHQGVIVEMAEDVRGLKALGLVGDRPLSRVTLGSRLEAILDVTEARRTQDRITAHAYAARVRVKAGRLGPRVGAEASKGHADNMIEKARIIDALAKYGSKSGASARPSKPRKDDEIIGKGETAKLLGITLAALRLRVTQLSITKEQVEGRIRELLNCRACMLVAVGERAGLDAHLTGCSRAAA